MLVYAKKMRLPKMGSNYVEDMAQEERSAMWISKETFDRVNALTNQHGVMYVEVEAPKNEEEVKEEAKEEAPKKRGGRPKKVETNKED